MDTSYYYNFIILVQTGNMTQAANILHITQPALSKQLKYLEAEFGTPLLHIKRGQRGANFVSLKQVVYSMKKHNNYVPLKKPLMRM